MDQGNDISIPRQQTEVAPPEFKKQKAHFEVQGDSRKWALVCVSQSVNKEHNLTLCIVYWQF